MNHCAELDVRKDARALRGAGIARSTKIIRSLVAAGAIGIVALALTAESRLTPEQRLELFESSRAYP